MPWSLDLARTCLHPRYGHMIRLPREELGWAGQVEIELEIMRLAAYVWRLFTDPKSRKADDNEFLLWIDEEFDTDDDRRERLNLNLFDLQV